MLSDKKLLSSNGYEMKWLRERKRDLDRKASRVVLRVGRCVDKIQLLAMNVWLTLQ